MGILVLSESDLRGLAGPEEALRAVRTGFEALAHGRAVLPGVLHLDLPQARGEVHVKGAHLHGSPFFSIKEAGGFWGNPERGLPMASGLVMVFDAQTGVPRAILLDNAYLTELRTGAAGALAALLLARANLRVAGILGAGSQARYQLEALCAARRPAQARVWSRRRESAEAFAREMSARLGLPVQAVGSAREAVEGCDLVVTTTTAREPVLRAEWIRPGLHVTAVGADSPEKQELEGEVLARADLVVADHLGQCLRLGEIHHAVAAGVMRAESVYAELGELAAGLKPGRTSDDQVTVADLTGVGVQDAALADLVVAEAERRGLGRMLEA
jgi:ectoine utilization protein EutC